MSFIIPSNIAQKVIESLRNGIPPEQFIEQFTVGRKEKITELRTLLSYSERNMRIQPLPKTAFLLSANYGTGKTHLLKLIRKFALEQKYAVSFISLDGQECRFNRMDHVLSWICRNLEFPNISGNINNPLKGISSLFDLIFELSRGENNEIKRRIIRLIRTSHIELNSPAIYTALKLWVIQMLREDDYDKDEISDWFYNLDKKDEPGILKENIRKLKEFPFSMRNWSNFRCENYKQSWDGLDDIDKLLKIAGFNRLILLFDEFEKCIQDLNDRRYQETALDNMLRFFRSGYNNLAFFAITPDFNNEITNLILYKGIDFDFNRIDKLDTFEMEPLSEDEVFELAKKIIDVHFKAYNWEIAKENLEEKCRAICYERMNMATQDRVRNTIKNIVNMLDSLME